MNCLVISYFQVRYIYSSTITIYTPTILFYTIYSIGITANIVDVHYTHTVVSVDPYFISIVSRSTKYIAVDTRNESLPSRAFFFEVYFSIIFALRVNNH